MIIPVMTIIPLMIFLVMMTIINMIFLVIIIIQGSTSPGQVYTSVVSQSQARQPNKMVCEQAHDQNHMFENMQQISAIFVCIYIHIY